MEILAWRAGVERIGASGDVVAEDGGVGVDKGAVIRAVMSSSCLSREDVVSASGRERVRLTVRWKARRSCFRFAGKDPVGLERSALACARRALRVSLGALLGSVEVGGGGGLGV